MTMKPKHTISRRTLLGGAAASIASSALFPLTGLNAATADPTGLRAIHQFHLGSMRVSVIDDARFSFPAPAFAANQPQGSIEPFLAQYGLPGDFANLHMQVTLVKIGAHKVLLDTGMGETTFPGNKPDNGRLVNGLAVLSVSPDDITSVVISHGHPDHIGSCSRDGEPFFKNAAYFMPPEELEFWTQKPASDDEFFNFMLRVGNEQLEPVRSLIKPYSDGDEIVPGIVALSAPGHTIGHHAFVLHNEGNTLLHLMDSAVHYLVGPEEPDWALAVEMDAGLAAATRRKLFGRAAIEKPLVAGYHFPFPGIGRIVEQGRSWRYIPMQTS